MNTLKILNVLSSWVAAAYWLVHTLVVVEYTDCKVSVGSLTGDYN